jgi:hypothetical protein
MLAGWRVVRFTWRQVVDRPEQVAATVRALLAAAPYGSWPISPP